MRIEVMLIARQSRGDTTSVSATLDLDTCRPGWEQGLVQAVTDQAHAGAEQLRTHLVAEEVADTFSTPTLADRFIPLASIVPSAAPGRPRA